MEAPLSFSSWLADYSSKLGMNPCINMSVVLCWRILFFSRQLFLFFAFITLEFYRSSQCSVDPFLIVHFINEIGPSYLLFDQQSLWYPPRSFWVYRLAGRPTLTQEIKQTGIREGNHLLSLTPSCTTIKHD